MGTRNLSLIAALTAALLGTESAAQNLLDDIKKKDLIVIAVPPDFPPYGVMGLDFNMTGLDVDIAKYIASKLGVRVDLIPVVTAKRIPYLQSKKAALVVATLGKTPEREKLIDYSIAYSPSYQGIFGSKSLGIRSFADLAGKTIAITRGSIEDQELSRLAPPTADIQRFESNTKTMSTFIAGVTQVIATAEPIAVNIRAAHPDLDVTNLMVIKDTPYHVGIPKGEESLRLKVNDILREARKSGDLDAISVKWIKRPVGNLQ